MSFSVRLSSDLTAVEAGATVPLSIEVANRSEGPDQFELEVEGLDPEWIAVPVPMFNIAAGEMQSEKVFFKPLRASESLGGNYPFVIKVRSLVSGESRSVQGILEIKPYHHLSMEVMPKKGYVSFFGSGHNDFTVTVMNLGNTEHTLQLFGTDPEDACTFDFEHEQITIGPGQQKEFSVIVNPSSRSLVSSSRLHGFSISARSVETPSIMSSAQAQLEQKPLLSPGALVVILALVSMIWLWVYLLPKPPTVKASIDKQEITLGESVQISWASANSTGVSVTANNKLLVAGPDISGSREYTPATDGIQTIEVKALRDSGSSTKESAPVHLILQVNKPIVADPPIIQRFSIDHSRVNINEPFIFHYRLSSSVTRAVLTPTNETIEPSTDKIKETWSTAGQVEFTLFAYNKDNKSVKKSITVNVEDRPTAKILAFAATPTKVDPTTNNLVVLSWQSVEAVRAELDNGDTKSTVDPTGTLQVNITKSREFTLTVFDSKGRSVSRKAHVTAIVPPVVPSAGDTGTSTTTTTGTTGGQR